LDATGPARETTGSWRKDKGAESEIFIADVRDEGQVGILGQDVHCPVSAARTSSSNKRPARRVRKNVAGFHAGRVEVVLDTHLTGAFLVSRASFLT